MFLAALAAGPRVAVWLWTPAPRSCGPMRRRSSQSWKLPSNSHGPGGCTSCPRVRVSWYPCRQVRRMAARKPLALFGVLFPALRNSPAAREDCKATLEGLDCKDFCTVQGPLFMRLRTATCSYRNCSRVRFLPFSGIPRAIRFVEVLSSSFDQMFILVMAHVTGRSC